MVENNTVLDFKSKRTSSIIGSHHVVRGPKESALELSKHFSYVKLGDFSDTCLPNPEDCQQGFTICFWINLRKVLHDGVILQLGLSRKSQGITVSTILKDNKALLAFYVNTPTIIHHLKMELSSDIWYHLGIVWNVTAKQKLSVFVNCSMMSNRGEKVNGIERRKGAGGMLMLGANHAGMKATPIAVDDLAIWFKSIDQERMCQVMNEEKG